MYLQMFIDFLKDFFSLRILKKIYEKRNFPRQGTPGHFAWTLQRLIDNPTPHEPYVAQCGGVGNHSDPRWWEEKIYQDDYESPFARATRLK